MCIWVVLLNSRRASSASYPSATVRHCNLDIDVFHASQPQPSGQQNINCYTAMPTIIWAVMRVVDLRFEAENDIRSQIRQIISDSRDSVFFLVYRCNRTVEAVRRLPLTEALKDADWQKLQKSINASP